MFELPNLHLHVVIVCFIISCQSMDKVLPRSRFTYWWVAGNSPCWCEQSTSSRFALIIQSFFCSLWNQMNRFLRSKNCTYTMRMCNWRLWLPRIHSGLMWYWKHVALCRTQPVRTLPMQKCSTEDMHSREAATGCRNCLNSCRHRHTSNPLSEQTLPLALVETFGVTLYCQTIAQVNAQTQRCQFVVVGSVVPAVLRWGKSASDDLMERLFNPTLNRTSFWSVFELKRSKSARESEYLCTPAVRIVTLRLLIRRRSNKVYAFWFVSQPPVALSLCSSLCPLGHQMW